MALSKPRKRRAIRPKHRMEARAYRFPMETSEAEDRLLCSVLDVCWEFRNVLAVEREQNRRYNRETRELYARAAQAGFEQEPLKLVYLNRAMQYQRVAELGKQSPLKAKLHSQVLQNLACRIDEGTQLWLDAIAEGPTKVRPPSSLDRKDYRSFTYPQYGKSSVHLNDGRIHLPKLGSFKLNQFRKFKGQPKAVTIKWDEGRWWAIVVCMIQAKDLYRSEAELVGLDDIGADPGLTNLLALADGTLLDMPRPLKDALHELRLAQRDLSRKFEARRQRYEAKRALYAEYDLPPLPPIQDLPYANRLKAQLKKVAILHTKVKHVRDFQHWKVANRLDRDYAHVALEEHGIKFMFANHRLAKSAADRGLAAMKHKVASVMGPKRYLPTANQRPGLGGNSQTCLCGCRVPKTLKDREHVCPNCGLTGKRDVVSANIVMQIAFGRNLLTATAAGPVVVRRGGTKGVTAVVPDAGQESEKLQAAEVPGKRQPSASVSSTSTSGGKVTPAGGGKRTCIDGQPSLGCEPKKRVQRSPLDREAPSL